MVSAAHDTPELDDMIRAFQNSLRMLRHDGEI
jgi:hypothetical protein